MFMGPLCDCKCQVKMYNFGGSIFRGIHHGYMSRFAALDEYPVICSCVTTRRRNSPSFCVFIKKIQTFNIITYSPALMGTI